MADTVIVMERGEIRQAASPVEIYRKPADAFVADFIGSTNLLPVERAGDGSILLSRPSQLRLPFGTGKATVSVRPEDVEITAPSAELPEGRISFVRDLGGSVEFFVDVAGTQVIAVVPPRNRPAVAIGDSVGLVIPPAASVVLTR